jgi:hypothetical protein
MKVASISISIGIVILANMVAFSVAVCCPPTSTGVCSDGSHCDYYDEYCCNINSQFCCNSLDLCAAPASTSASAPVDSAPAPVDNTPFVYPFTEQAFTNEEAPAMVFDKLQELSAANGGGLRNFASVHGDLFVDPTISANNVVHTVVTNNAAFGTPAVQFLELGDVPAHTSFVFGDGSFP